MSEGELKKRLNQHCFEAVAVNYGNCDFDNIEKILDDAKADFPKLTQADKDEWVEDFFDSFISNYEEWFKRWFGEAETK